MELDEYRSYDALGLAGLVRDGSVQPHELLDCALTAIERANPSLNAVVGVYADEARRAIDAGLPDGPFRGVPFGIKDLWAEVAGLPTSNGSRLFAGIVADHDMELVRRYRAAGLVIAAKTNTPEFGVSPSTEPALTGPTHNPWRAGYSAGGSSGGAAAAVAGGLLPMAHASDGGGSIRIPSAYCGLFGLKPSRGRITAGPDRGDGWAGMSTHHVVTRSVRDSAAALDVTAGPMPGDPYAAPPAPASYLTEVTVEPGRLRVGLALDAPTGAPVDPAMRAVAEATAKRCEALGHEVTAVAWPFTPEELRAASSISAVHVAAAIDARLAALGRGQRPDDLEPVTAMIVEVGRAATGIGYVRAVDAMHRIGRLAGALFETVDVLVTPTVGRAPFPHGILSGSDVDRFIAEVGSVACFTMLANLTGQPAMSLPLDLSDDGMPLGSQVIGRYGDEATLLRLAGQLERAHPWADRLPAGAAG